MKIEELQTFRLFRGYFNYKKCTIKFISQAFLDETFQEFCISNNT